MPAQTDLRPILTYHDTLVFADIASGRLRHGPPGSSPRNVFLAASGGKAYLLYVTPDQGRYCIRVPKERQHLAANLTRFEPMPWIQGFRIVDGGALAKNAIALSYDSHFLCAELDGRITLSRPRIGLWELFRTEDAIGRSFHRNVGWRRNSSIGPAGLRFGAIGTLSSR